MKRRPSLRPSGGGVVKSANRSRRPSASALSGVPGGISSPAHVQLLSLPQLDAVQRTLRLLDVRMQHVQTSARHDEKMRDDVEHVRRVMSENQKALNTIVTVLSAIQEEVRVLSISVYRQQQQQQPRLELLAPRKRSSEKHGSAADLKTAGALRDNRDATSRDRQHIFDTDCHSLENSRL